MQTDPAHQSSDSTAPEARRLALFNRAERLGCLGSWEWVPQTGELLWSDNLFRLFGHEPGSLTPSSDVVLDQVHVNDRERVAVVVAALADGTERVNHVDCRIVRTDGVVRHLRATLAVLEESDPGERRLFGSAQDVTSARRVDRNLEAYASVSAALDEWVGFEPGAEALLSGLAGALDLAFGALWVPLRDELACRGLWHEGSASLAVVAEATAGWRPGRGSPSLGRAWTDRQPVVSQQPGSGSPPERATAMREAGLVATIAVPAVMVDETLAVLEFLSVEAVEPSDQLMRALTGIGHEIGYFLAQHRGALGEPLLTPREVQILQLAARAYSAADIAEELYLSRATVKRHFERAYARLGVSDRAAAVAEAMRQGLIT
jgi:DNA-binding CsgD family transcriptional regulator